MISLLTKPLFSAVKGALKQIQNFHRLGSIDRSASNPIPVLLAVMKRKAEHSSRRGDSGKRRKKDMGRNEYRCLKLFPNLLFYFFFFFALTNIAGLQRVIMAKTTGQREFRR